MFDFRYHVASLAAVFVALIIGILVGVGLSGQGFVTDSERDRLERDKAQLEGELEAERNRADGLERGQQAGADFAEDAYPVLAADRLRGRQVSLVVIGSLGDTEAVDAVRDAIDDAGGRLVRMYALRVPLEPAAVQETLRGRSELAGYVGRDSFDDLGRDIGRELVVEGPTPLLNALADELVEERSGPSDVGADAVVVVRAAPPQMGATADFVNGVYSGLASAGVPAVGAETREALPSAVPAFSRGRLSTVDDVDTPSGRLALVLLLAGAEPGHYGRHEDTATDGLLPPIEELSEEPGDGGG